MPTTDASTAGHETGDPVLDLAMDLIARESVTPRDAGCQELLATRLAALGFHIEHHRVGEVDNLWARLGTGGPVLAFAGHTDVVPTGDRQRWSRDPFRPVIEGDLLHGRGAADMKGSLAAMIVAAERLLADTELAGSLAFLITSDEEGPARDGTRALMHILETRAEHIDHCIVGEPSSGDILGDVVRVGRRGSLNAHLRVRGIQGHVAYPDLARNPVHQALDALRALTERVWDQGNEFFPPTSMQISNVRAGTGATNVIPGELEVDFNFRFSTEQTADRLKTLVEGILDEAGLEYGLRWALSGEPFLTRGGALVDAVRAAVREVSGIEPELSTAGGTSDGRFIAPSGTEVVELGPANATIHKVDECVPVAHLTDLARAYEGIMRQILT